MIKIEQNAIVIVRTDTLHKVLKANSIGQGDPSVEIGMNALVIEIPPLEEIESTSAFKDFVMNTLKKAWPHRSHTRIASKLEEAREEGNIVEIQDINKMPADRKLDALVAEMMGCSVAWEAFPWLPSGKTFPFCTCEFLVHGSGPNRVPGLLMSYSTDIAAADLVIDWLHSLKLLITVRDDPTAMMIWCAIDKPGWEPRPQRHIASVAADTRPLAICRAALKALKIMETSND